MAVSNLVYTPDPSNYSLKTDFYVFRSPGRKIHLIFGRNCMIMKTFLSAFVCLVVVWSVNAQSGLLKTIGGAAKNKVEQQDFNSTRSNKEKGNLQDDQKKSSPAPAPGSAADTSAQEEIKPAIPGGSEYESSYTFDQKLTYLMDDPQKPEKEKVTMAYSYSDNAIMSYMPDNNMAMLVDFTHQTSIMFDEKAKTAMVMPANWMGRALEKEEAENPNVTVTKTGNTKKILGYTCEEYIIQDEKTKSVVWVTTEIKMDYAKTYMAMSRGGKSTGMEGFGEQGLMMEMTGYNKKGEADVHMIMTEYKEETVVKNLSDYKITAL